MLAFLLLMMLSTLPKAVHPNAMLRLISGNIFPHPRCLSALVDVAIYLFDVLVIDGDCKLVIANFVKWSLNITFAFPKFMFIRPTGALWESVNLLSSFCIVLDTIIISSA